MELYRNSGYKKDRMIEMLLEEDEEETLYDILGISPNATPDQIRKAYIKLIKSAHPDKGGDENEFEKITEAYYVLSKEIKRAEYDKKLNKAKRDATPLKVPKELKAESNIKYHA